ncbi:FMN-dependent NADH-azoreductase [Desulfosarcina cetonica]|uniref:FMN-dependent NADH-azoreductase n=1 Tax=Desulfosarcina cetonica TaxID=90730 RepID=UPI0006D12A3A|nr:NAD(P)H-dependent oxidoreductase [Desulfosarcina cetonica]VTR68755.1 FMN-dependent NADH-azoreductase [Desulfosarcina cetonica]
MASLLYITCNLKPVEQSRSLTVAKAFLDTYLQYHPNDRIDFVDVYRDPVQRIDMDVLSGWQKLQEGIDFAALTEHEQRKILNINSTAEQFADADKYAFVTPMWNLNFPAELKMYLDTVCVLGKTFIYTENGPVGLLGGKGKKCLHIHSSGGFHYGKAEDHSVPYLKALMNFMGIDLFQAVVIEGVDAIPHMATEFVKKACDECHRIATTF